MTKPSIRETPGTFLIVLSGDPTVKRVVEAMRRKLFEFIHKDKFFFENLLAALTRAFQLKGANENKSDQRFLSESPKVHEVIQMSDRILRSQSGASILILGETGTGKEFLAQHIARGMKKSLVAANMGSIPRETAESILFGHERGAFTGAVSSKIGLIESANDGILFLDEIGECSPSVQTKLLRVLQEHEVQPLGSTGKPRKVRVQFIAATHQNLDQMVAEGKFRLDLLQRLNTFVLTLPPLRERPEDVLLYSNLFLSELTSDGRHYSISPDGLHALLAHSWPGNVRELRSVIQRILVISDRVILAAETVNEAIGMGCAKQRVGTSKVTVLEANFRRSELLNALKDHHGNKRHTARTLGISEATIYRWIQEFGLAGLPERAHD